MTKPNFWSQKRNLAKEKVDKTRSAAPRLHRQSCTLKYKYQPSTSVVSTPSEFEVKALLLLVSLVLLSQANCKITNCQSQSQTQQIANNYNLSLSQSTALNQFRSPVCATVERCRRDRSFAVAGPLLWNSLPIGTNSITSAGSLAIIKKQLKTFLFWTAYDWHVLLTVSLSDVFLWLFDLANVFHLAFISCVSTTIISLIICITAYVSTQYLGISLHKFPFGWLAFAGTLILLTHFTHHLSQLLIFISSSHNHHVRQLLLLGLLLLLFSVTSVKRLRSDLSHTPLL